jgi:hypothetical protein
VSEEQAKPSEPTGVAALMEAFNRMLKDGAITAMWAAVLANMQKIEAAKAQFETKPEPKPETWRDRPPLL